MGTITAPAPTRELDDLLLTPRPFDAEENRFTDQLARGHYRRANHHLAGHWEYERDSHGLVVRRLVRSCCTEGA